MTVPWFWWGPRQIWNATEESERTKESGLRRSLAPCSARFQFPRVLSRQIPCFSTLWDCMLTREGLVWTVKGSKRIARKTSQARCLGWRKASGACTREASLSHFDFMFTLTHFDFSECTSLYTDWKHRKTTEHERKELLNSPYLFEWPHLVNHWNQRKILPILSFHPSHNSQGIVGNCERRSSKKDCHSEWPLPSFSGTRFNM